MARAYSYLRFSTPDQTRGDSFRRQSELAATYAHQHGMELDESLTFHDLGVSAYRGRNAETGRLGDFLEAVRGGLVEPGSTLLVESLDRISRQAARRALRVLEDIVDRGVDVVTMSDNRRYSKEALDNDPMALLMAILTFIRANEESAVKASRLQAAWKAKRAKAAEKPLTAVCPAWLHLRDGRFEPIAERVEVVRRVFREAATGKGQHGIAEGLNRDGVPTFGHRGRCGAYWHRSYIVKLLSSDTVVGTMTPHRMDHSTGKPKRVPLEPVQGYYPAVVPMEDWQAVQALGQSRTPLRGRHANAGIVRNVFGGIARCAHCEGAVIRVSKGPGWEYLVCAKAKAGAGCHYRTARYPAVEKALLEGLDLIEVQCPTGNAAVDSVAAEIAALDEQVSLIRDDIAGLLPSAGRSPVIAHRVMELEAEIEAIRNRQSALGKDLDMSLPGRLEGRLGALRKACESLAASSEGDDKGALRGAVNVALRGLCGSVDVNPIEGSIVLYYLHGGAVSLTYDPLAGFQDETRKPM
jgi:DNA invertase Pin-like site-specific DNA recombinase